MAWWTALATAAAVPTIPILPIPLTPKRVDPRVVLLHPDRLKLLDVGAGGVVVAGEVVVDVVAEVGIEDALLVQRHADPHRHAAEELRAGGDRVDDPPGREHAECRAT